MIGKIKKILLDNIKIKAICILLAMILWLFVASNQSLLGKFPNPIKVNPINLGSEYQAFLDEQNVQVSIMAEQSIWRSLTTDSFSASVDLAGLKEGTYEMDVRVSVGAADVQITKIEPSKIFVNIEKVTTKSIQLTPKIEGDAADGMVVGQIMLEPESIQVRGPSSYIDVISEANAIIKLNGESESFEREAKIVAINGGSEADLITFIPPVVNAKVAIVKGGNNKSVGIKVRTKGSPKENYYISKITTNPVVSDISGQRSILTNINYLETEEIDLSNMSESSSREVNLIIPDGVSLQRGVLPRVKVDLSFAIMGATKSMSVVVAGLNLPDGTRLVSYSPSDIRATLSGPSSLLNNLSSSDIRLEINLAGKGVGSHNIDINPTLLRLPEGVVASSLTSSSITIVLGN